MAFLTLTDRQRESFKSQNLNPTAFLDDGTFSSVLSAVNEVTGQAVAVKVLDKLLVLKHDKSCAVLEEKRIHSTLLHENIVKLFSTFQDDQSLYFVLELCEGGNLLKFQTQLTKNEASLKDFSRSFAIQLISAVKYCHSMGIIHRDIKPENVLLSKDLEIKLADFGSCIDMNKPKNDLLGKFVGTPEYLAPEILKNSIKYDHSAFALDWWALGCTLYWLLTGGKVLFEAGTEYLVYKAIEAGPSAASLKQCCDLDGIMAEIIFGLLERDPLKRMAFIKDQLDDLLVELSKQ